MNDNVLQMRQPKIDRPVLRNFAFCGVRGAGKTYAMMRMLRTRARWVFVDPKSNAEASIVSYSAERIAATLKAHDVYEIAWHCGHLTPAKMREGLEVITNAMISNRGTIDTLAIDEVGVLCPKKSITLPDRVMSSARMGRDLGFSIWVASQRAVDIHPDVRQLCDGTLVFRQEEQLDVNRLNQVLKGLGEAARGLKPHFYYYVSGGKARHMKPMGG